jgi:predicted amidohydrolase YtcJ
MKMKKTGYLLAFLGVGFLGGVGGPAQTPRPETVLYNGKVVTVDASFSYAEAVAIAGGKFVAVGKNDTVRHLAGPTTRLIDLKGRTVIPGLTDDHLHSAGGGPGVDLSRARTLNEVLRAIEERAQKTPAGEIITTNSDWHEAQLAEQRLPLRRDLDRVAPRHPLVVVRGGHEYILNSAALEKWNIDRGTLEPPGGKISRYEDGELNGELVDRAKDLVKLPPPRPMSLQERIEETLAQYKTLHRVGLTGVRHPGGSIEQYRLLQEMKRRGLLTMRITQLLRVAASPDPAQVRAQVESWGVGPDEGDEWLSVGGIKLGVDGGFEGGWMREPYEEPWGQGGAYRGIQTLPAETYTATVKELNRLGWRVFTHAVGDAAIDLVLAAYESANAERSIVARRWGIEHGFIPRSEHFPRLKKLGLLVSAQNHLYLAGPSLVKYWGASRAAWTTPVRAYLDQGLLVGGGTDAPVVPYPPLWVIYHFVTRDTITGGVVGSEQKITREEALRLSTAHNAYFSFEEKVKGSIEPGKLADLVVLAEDIMTCPEKRIEQMEVLLTLVGGKVVYQHPDFGGPTSP